MVSKILPVVGDGDYNNQTGWQHLHVQIFTSVDKKNWTCLEATDLTHGWVGGVAKSIIVMLYSLCTT